MGDGRFVTYTTTIHLKDSVSGQPIHWHTIINSPISLDTMATAGQVVMQKFCVNQIIQDLSVHLGREMTSQEKAEILKQVVEMVARGPDK